MRLWLLTRVGRYRTVDEAVVRAESEIIAREMCARRGAHRDAEWSDPDRTECVELSAEGAEEMLIWAPYR